MPLTVFLAFCILGFDFLLYVLFQWVYVKSTENTPAALPHARNAAALPHARNAAALPHARNAAPFPPNKPLSLTI